jgi:hypothetical protein
MAMPRPVCRSFHGASASSAGLAHQGSPPRRARWPVSWRGAHGLGGGARPASLGRDAHQLVRAHTTWPGIKSRDTSPHHGPGLAGLTGRARRWS